ncbi:hypothetical protein R6Q57_023517 [Mikania cordata]
MRIQYTGIAFLAITVFILMIALVSSSRNIHRITIEGMNQRFQPQFNSSHPVYTPTPAASLKESWNDTTDPIIGVSQRAIPGGPNPLHN